MKISAKTDYACKALVELSLHWPNKSPLAINTIARNQQIPIKFLTQILLTLKQLGYVQSTRGKTGGYLLTKKPKLIKLSDLLSSMEDIGLDENQNGKDVLNSIWNEVDQAALKVLDRIDFEEICNRKRSRDNIVMFEI